LTAPVDYMPVYAYVRADETRFDGDLAKINDAGVTISVIEDTASRDIADQDFARAAQYAVTEEADGAHLLLAVTTRKADVAFADPFTADDFIKNNPGVLKQTANAPPARVFGESFAVARGEDKLRDMLNVALTQMQASGFIRQTLDKYLADRKGEYFYAGKKWE
jgi:ABC-type amino acid transport substrate-binding protein